MTNMTDSQGEKSCKMMALLIEAYLELGISEQDTGEMLMSAGIQGLDLFRGDPHIQSDDACQEELDEIIAMLTERKNAGA